MVWKLLRNIAIVAVCCIMFAAPESHAEVFGVHLESFRSPEAAHESWSVLRERHPGILADAGYAIERADLGPERGVYYRILIGPFAERGRADAVAAEFAAKDVYAMVMSFTPYSAAEPELERVVEEPTPEPELTVGPTPEPVESDAAPVALASAPEPDPEPALDPTPVENPSETYTLDFEHEREQDSEVADAYVKPGGRAHQDVPQEERQEAVISAGLNAGDPASNPDERWEPCVLAEDPADPQYFDDSIPVKVRTDLQSVSVTTRLADNMSTTVRVTPSIADLDSQPSGSVEAGMNVNIGSVSLGPKVHYDGQGNVEPYAGVGVHF
ncbi:MAG: hypothetical protein D6E12_17095 [Desulfovibrio sp.]|nr:MAG: hypothetical protein D6E12_17095 [Desulfovibrio sp.]